MPFYLKTMNTNDQDKEQIESLIEFVKKLRKKNLAPFLRELTEEPSDYSVYYNRPVEVWQMLSRELTGLSASGSDIHTFLHPKPQEQGIGLVFSRS